MKSPALLLALCAAAQGLSLHQPRDGHPRVLQLDLQRNHIPNPVAHDRLRRRSGTVNGTLDNMQTLYFLNVSMGTPAQDLRMHLDTGSSDLWVNTARSAMCSMRSQPCSASGTYTANTSSTYAYLGSYFNISYVDGSGAAGDYVTDTLHVDGHDFTGFQFGIGYTSTSAQNVLGIGYPANEVQVARSGLKAYQNMPARMAADGVIASSAYSLWLNDVDANTGSILFGGVDASRYSGNLVSVPILQVDGTYLEFFITMTGLDMGSNPVGEQGMALAVLLDSGSSLTYLPDDLTQSVYEAVNATYQEDEGVAFVPCSLRDSGTSMTFHFSSPAAVAVPVREMILDLKDLTGKDLSFDNGVPACLFGISPAGTSTSVLGDTFLRSAYVVYDMANNEIALAQTRFNASAPDVREIGGASSPVPSAAAVNTPVAAASGLPAGGSDGNGKAAGRNKNGGGGVVVPSAVLVGVLVGVMSFVV
ncbi:putative aspartic-type endopeptidase opsB [Tolypocladium ophioglossoides CBS 100239]|uniref:Probable aspartic-type endopeptidase OPSB n=1 Tax=Tolypocladium ophioglossoides (strain CBS 100239) TaxID=1163406 RepID=A0A0L0NEA1_TOLOC|nr:putative aspartic-type endopeptidase opsB [Tolypocladium ophioglossoides CBS 100239]